MDPAARTLALVADLLNRAGHPDIAAVAVLDTPTVRADLRDSSKNYVKVAHVQPANTPAPGRPSWPGHMQAGGR